VSRLSAGTAPSALRAAANGVALPVRTATPRSAAGPASARAAGPLAATAVAAASAAAAATAVLNFLMVPLLSLRCVILLS
jgi:hypothetical protein